MELLSSILTTNFGLDFKEENWNHIIQSVIFTHPQSGIARLGFLHPSTFLFPPLLELLLGLDILQVALCNSSLQFFLGKLFLGHDLGHGNCVDCCLDGERRGCSGLAVFSSFESDIPRAGILLCPLGPMTGFCACPGLGLATV
ncbi:hypothetical protein KC340_g156 [Hortaea werneckii]|nr:hypothetical protein KC340_g156 [Hortaea werneckii]